MASIDHKRLELHERWETLQHQIHLIQQTCPNCTNDHVIAVLDWLYTRLDHLEMDLGALVTESPSGGDESGER